MFRKGRPMARRLGKRKSKGEEESAGREKALEAGLEGSFPASDPVAAVHPTPSLEQRRGGHRLRISSHVRSDIVELSDRSRWRIWPGDLPTTLNWMPNTEIEVHEIADPFCSHVLVGQSDGSRVRVIEASRDWPVRRVQRSLGEG